MRLEDLFCNHVQPETKISPEDISREVTAAYLGHLKAEAERYRCDAEALDKVLGGAGHFIDIANSCYDYAVNGRLNTTNLGIQDDNWLDFASFINQARWNEEFHSTDSLPLGLEKLFKLGAIRARLDLDTLGKAAHKALPTVLQGEECGYLTLSEVAVLAQMNEKSVRNATQPTAPDRLPTRKQGTRTVVDSHEALRWLKGRRNFNPSVFV
ncbi:hypothetical protein [Pseudomonas grandcourensis]|uniref:hypothetical protein n=1 Tax=Pseudomonas grandcourensis TaxID=3136736 RepID=UPI00326710AE